jgi:carbon monoxide dehydrogenase subunit G
MHVERQFRVERDRDDVVERLCDDKTLVELFPGETEIIDSEGGRRTLRTRYELLGRDVEVTFHFTYLLDGNVRFEKVCDGRVWRELIGRVTVDEARTGAQVRIEMQGRTKALVPERAIKQPLEDHIGTMADALHTLLA